MVVTEFFDDFSSIDTSRWQPRVSGSGSVTASDSNAVLDEGGANNDDCAALVLKAPLDFTADWVAAVCIKFTGTAPGYPPNLFGIYDDSAVPGISTNSSRQSRQRIWFENQTSSGAASNNRWQYRLKDGAASTVYTWRNLSDDWSTSFEHSHTRANEDNYLILCFYHKVGSGMRLTGYGYDSESASDLVQGSRLIGDTDWAPFGTSAGQIDPIDNDAYMVIGDIVNDNGGLDHTVSVEWARLHEVQGDDREFALIAGAGQGSPFPYDIREYVCPLGLLEEGSPLWLPAEHHPDDDIVISRGTDDWVQDAYTYNDVGTYYLLSARREAGDVGHIQIQSGASYSAAKADTPVDIIDYDDTGFDANVDIVRCPQLIKDEGTFYLFMYTEGGGPTTFRIWRATCTGGDPTVAGDWDTITEVLAGSGTASAYDEDGVGHFFVIRYNTNDWRMVFGAFAADGKVSVGIASASSITGSWTKDGQLIANSTNETQFNGANNSSATYTVDSSSAFSVNQPVLAGPQVSSKTRFRPTRIRKINSSTEVELWHRIPVADNEFLTGYTAYAIVPRSLRVAPEGGYWEMWATIFRFGNTGAAQEVTGRFVSAEDETTDPVACTFTLSTDHGFPWAGLTFRPNYNFFSEENIGFIWTVDDLILTQAGDTAIADSSYPLRAI